MQNQRNKMSQGLHWEFIYKFHVHSYSIQSISIHYINLIMKPDENIDGKPSLNQGMSGTTRS